MFIRNPRSLKITTLFKGISHPYKRFDEENSKILTCFNYPIYSPIILVEVSFI